jgi:hypothetical protein
MLGLRGDWKTEMRGSFADERRKGLLQIVTMVIVVVETKNGENILLDRDGR